MKTDMTQGKPVKVLLGFTIPVFIGNVFQQFYNMVDAVVVGKFVGTKALAAVGSTGTIIFLIIGFLLGLTAGFTVLTAQKYGAGKMDEMRQTVGNALILTALISAVMTAVSMTGMHALLKFMHTPDDIFKDAYAYVMIICGGIFAQALYNILASILRALGNSKVPLYFLILSAMLNIVLDPIFIFGLHMGVRGAALATIISQACSCIWVVSFLFGKKTFLKIQRKNMKLEARIILPSLALGLATFIMQASESIITVCFNSSLLKYGGDIAVGAMTILTSVMQFAMLPLQGLGQGAQPILSYNYGAKNVDRVRGTFRLLLKVSVGYAVILWLCVELFPQIFVSMFTSDAALLAFGKTALRVYMAAMFMFGIQIACQMGFTSLGCAPESIIVAVMRKFVLLIPLIYIVPHIWSADRTMGVYLAEPIADFFAVTFTMILFSNRFKKALKKIEK